MKNAEKIVTWIIEKSGFLGIMLLIGMMLLTVTDVALRFFLKSAIVGSFEISMVIMACIVFLGIGLCALEGGHIQVDIILDLLSKRWRRLLDSFNYFLTMAVVLLVATQCISRAIRLIELDLRSNQLGIPQYPFLLVTAYGFILFFLAVIILQKNIKKN